MTAKLPKKPAATPPPTATQAPEKSFVEGIGGSESFEWNAVLFEQAGLCFQTRNADTARTTQRVHAIAAALRGVDPKDELEGMIAAQLIAAHNAAMDCYQRAMAPGQPPEDRRADLSQAAKISRTWSSLLEALSRYRGKGQQKVTVEHVHVHSGGQAVVGTVETRGGGARGKT
jgi:hypothetical protein